jgi:hypothetical protein
MPQYGILEDIERRNLEITIGGLLWKDLNGSQLLKSSRLQIPATADKPSCGGQALLRRTSFPGLPLKEISDIAGWRLSPGANKSPLLSGELMRLWRATQQGSSELTV